MHLPRQIPFNRPTLRGKELAYIGEALAQSHLAGDGPFTGRVEALLEARLGAPQVLLTHSCSAALELAALLTAGPGDEIVMPSFTYVTTASAFARRGAVPVFADIDPETLTLDPGAAAAAIGPKTRAIVAVHYAGIGAGIESLRDLAAARGLTLIEDAAQAVGAHAAGQALGTFGRLGTLSFHATKNVTAGEGGALIVNDPALAERARILRDRGTDQARFRRGEVCRYGWVDLGSAYAPAEIVAAFLLAQLEQADAINAARLCLWERYHSAFAELERSGAARRPVVPAAAVHNGHLYYLLLPDAARRDAILDGLRRDGIEAAFHYAPLHDSAAGRRYGRCAGSLAVTESAAARLVRLPMHLGLGEADQDRVIAAVGRTLHRG